MRASSLNSVGDVWGRSEEHTSELQSRFDLVCRLLLEKKNTLDFVGYPRFPAPVEFIAAVIAYYVHPVHIQTACLIMEGAEFTENIINGVERPVKAAELFAFTLRVRAGNTDVLTDAEENVRQKLRAEGVMFFFFIETAPAVIYTLSLHDALPI